MLKHSFILTALLLASGHSAPSLPTQLDYTLHVDSANTTGVTVELRIRNAPAAIRLAAHAHPEYDDKYWRYLEELKVTNANGTTLALTREDSVVWRVGNIAGDLLVRYRVGYPLQSVPRSSWLPFLTATGGLIGGPHSFLYVVGAEQAPVTVTLDLPRSWRVGTGLAGASTARNFTAPDLLTLMESPMLVGEMSEWTFRVQNTPHRVFYLRSPDAIPFDTVTFVRGIEGVAGQAITMFGSAPYREYTFLFQDGAYSGGLEHPNSVTLGARSSELALDPQGPLPETAHEFVHTWNLMAIRPIEYRGVDYRPQPPVAGLWFSEGLTLYYADLFLRRANLSAPGESRLAHLEQLITRYLEDPGNARFSAEAVSRVEYNAPRSALGDYTASTHLQGELIGNMLDLQIRASSRNTRSMDDVMRGMYLRFKSRGFTGTDVQHEVETACACNVATFFDQHIRGGAPIDFNRYLIPLGMRLDTTWQAEIDKDGKPVRDLRMWGWQEDGEPLLRLRVSDPASIWGRAGLHTNDQLISINGAPIRSWPALRSVLNGLTMGDSVDIVVQRPAGPLQTRVVMAGLIGPVVHIVELPNATPAQRAIWTAWLAGR